ncbi:MAG TPA: transporter [Polyangiaceae bacterium]
MTTRASAQACCAGGSAITPGRLLKNEQFLVGLQLRTASVIGSFDANARFRGPAAGTSEWDFEQDLFATLRVLTRAQLSLLVPVLESSRRSPNTGREFGGGFGDLNFGARYDFLWAHDSPYIPGIAGLAGVTLPTGRAPEAAHLPLGSDATGIGAWQANLGLALEQAFGAWLLDLTALAARRSERRIGTLHSQLGTRFSAIAALGYVLSGDLSLALGATYTTEGNSAINGQEVAGTMHRSLELAGFGVWSPSNVWRVQWSVFLDPPLDGLGQNQLTTTGASVALLRTFL